MHRRIRQVDQFCQALVDATACSPDGAYEAWLGLGGAPKPAEKKKESKGFFGAFADSIKENAGGVKDTRPKDKWGDDALMSAEKKDHAAVAALLKYVSS